jgi:hypothetical protein
MNNLDQRCEFKLATDYLGFLLIDRFLRTRSECELILETGLLRWDGWIYTIDKERSWGATKPTLTPFENTWFFITNDPQPVRQQCSAERFGKTGQGFNYCRDCRSFWPKGEEHQHLRDKEYLELAELAGRVG